VCGIPISSQAGASTDSSVSVAPCRTTTTTTAGPGLGPAKPRISGLISTHLLLVLSASLTPRTFGRTLPCSRRVLSSFFLLQFCLLYSTQIEIEHCSHQPALLCSDTSPTPHHHDFLLHARPTRFKVAERVIRTRLL